MKLYYPNPKAILRDDGPHGAMMALSGKVEIEVESALLKYFGGLKRPVSAKKLKEYWISQGKDEKTYHLDRKYLLRHKLLVTTDDPSLKLSTIPPVEPIDHGWPIKPYTTPKSIKMNLLSICNLRCKHCIINASTGKKGFEGLTTTAWLDIFEQAEKMSPLSISLSGGEPLLHRDLPVLLKKIGRTRARLTLFSNLAIQNEKALEAIVATSQEEKPASFVLGTSLDGLLVEHNNYRGSKNAFQMTSNIAKTLIEKGVFVYFQTSLRSEISSNDYLKKLIDHIAGLGCRQITLYTPSLTGRAKHLSNDFIFDFAYFQHFRRTILPSLRKAHSNMDIKLETPRFPSFIPSKKIDPKVPLAKGACTGGISNLYITENGNLTPCVELPNLHIGNIKDKRLLEIWNVSEGWEFFRGGWKVTETECFKYCPRFDRCTLSDCKSAGLQVGNPLIKPTVCRLKKNEKFTERR